LVGREKENEKQHKNFARKSLLGSKKKEIKKQHQEKKRETASELKTRLGEKEEKLIRTWKKREITA